MTHIYMTISLYVSLKTLLFSVALQSLTAQQHRLRIYIRLHREKPHLKREGFKTYMEPHMLYGVHIHSYIHQVYFIFSCMVLSKMLQRPPLYSRMTNSRRTPPHKCSGCTTLMDIHLSIYFKPWLPMVYYQIIWALVHFSFAHLV